MSNLHVNLDEANKHTPKGFDSAVNNTFLTKDESGLSTYRERMMLDKAIDFVDGTLAPPTTANGDIYVLTGSGTVEAGWGDADFDDWVIFQNGIAVIITPLSGYLCYDTTASQWKEYDGTNWVTADANSTNLSEGTVTNTTVDVNSDTGTNATLQEASTLRAGVMSKAKFDEVEANNAKVSNVTTDLGVANNTATNIDVTSSDGTDATLPPATTSLAGLMTGADKTKLDGISSGATNVTELNDLTDVNTGLPGTPTQADDGKMLFFDTSVNDFITDDTVTHGTSVINGKKASVGTIAKGKPVYLVGFDADLHTVEEANATSSATMPVIGFAAETMDDTNSKHIMTFGKLTGIDTSSFSVGDDLYMDTTTGQLTATRPTGATTLIQRVAKVLRSDVSGGQLLIFNTARTAGLQANTAAQARTVLNVADGANNYVHPNHTGEVTSIGDGATVVDSTAISNKTVLGSLAGTEEFLVNDGGALKKILASNVGGADGNGIYDGDGTIPAVTIATLTNWINFTGGNFGIGIAPTAKFSVRGDDQLVTSSSLLVENGVGGDLFDIRNNGEFLLGGKRSGGFGLVRWKRKCNVYR
jgi:hypothetical protein